ncbi:hypothetical protein L584_17485 [Pantoea agglomerans Tx10]|nr:hypothetical protein L584_17485 [Pantoea agglomerans Tx10]
MACVEAIFDIGCCLSSITIFHYGCQIIIICALARKIMLFTRWFIIIALLSEKDETSIALIKNEINQKT